MKLFGFEIQKAVPVVQENIVKLVDATTVEETPFAIRTVIQARSIDVVSGSVSLGPKKYGAWSLKPHVKASLGA